MKQISRLVLCGLAAAAIGACSHDDNIDNGGGGSFVRVWGSSNPGLVDGDAATARFSNPAKVAVAPDSTVYVADYDNNVVRAISPDGIVSVVVGQANFGTPFGLCLSPDGKTVYIETDANDEGNRDATTGTIWALDRAAGTVSVVAHNLGRPRGILALADGRIVLSDLAQNTLSFLDPASGTVTPLAGTAGSAGFANGSGTAALFSRPYGLTQLPDGSLLVADQNNNAIRQVTLAGVVSTYANTAGTAGAANGAAASASFNGPEDVAAAPNGDVYVADTFNHVIRRISGGTVSTEAGNGTAGFVDADGAAAEFFGLEGIGLSADGAVLWIADGNGGNGDPYNRVRRIQVP